ncbi:hypothetical protein GCM10007416_29680 [Kroppenstedtia guangzhouensis]|jgi:chorismate-pyruvate lyase|uniref:Chorismate lyase n=1 Tax=Kroppenstedtia guangzhouensis TaxID=1274356 RepID=A0ABQ1H2D0_9BACL|nr:chorismate pyruvate-lyase family protein [Kroppenstedtia guangzhouensis]GGA54551.1 hypothetical protein GCM10007416_29680 [Kroppenstedtia guangzhouensis]
MSQAPIRGERLAQGMIQDLLLYSDGTTTRMIEILVHQQVEIHVFRHSLLSFSELPDHVPFTSEGPFLKRLSSLMLNGRYLSYNVVYADMSCMPDYIANELRAKRFPIGKIIHEYDTRREFVELTTVTSEEMDDFHEIVPLSSTMYPKKGYHILHQGKPLFHVIEYFDLPNLMHFHLRD